MIHQGVCRWLIPYLPLINAAVTGKVDFSDFR